MGRSVDALVTKEVLTWARQTIGYSPEDAAEKIGVEPPRIIDWEGGHSKPTVAQLKSIARVYKRPFSCFYLPIPPAETAPPHDFRRIHGAADIGSGPQLALAIRTAEMVRETTLELLATSHRKVPAFSLRSPSNLKAEELGLHLRTQLRVNYDQQASWRDKRLAYNNWRSLLVRHGILALQFSDVGTRDARGFSLYFDELPIISINSGDQPAGRSFTLFHELSHIVLRQSGICDIFEELPRKDEDQRTEVFCNAVAGNFLIPREYLRHGMDKVRVSTLDLDQRLSSLSNLFSVSRLVVLRRMLDCGYLDKPRFEAKHNELVEEYEKPRPRRPADKPIRISVANTTVSNLGLPYVGLVLDQHRRGKISLNAAADSFSVKPKHLKRIENLYLQRAGGRSPTE